MTWPDARTKGPFINDFVSKSTPFFLLLYIKAVGFFQCFDTLSPISTGFYKYPQSKLDLCFWPLDIADVEYWWPLILSVAYSRRQSGHVWRDTLFESTRILSSSWARQPTLYIRCLSSFCRLLSSLCSQWQSLQLCASPLPTYMQGNGQSQERRWQRTDGRRVGGFRRRTYPKYVRGVAHTYIARHSSPALPPSTLIIAWHERIQAGLSMPWQHA